jgi:hypothetical protein
MYQDEIAHARDLRALFRVNAQFFVMGIPYPLQVIERMEGWLWLGYNGPDKLVTRAALALREAAGYHIVELLSISSLGVPFRESVRKSFMYVLRMKPGFPSGPQLEIHHLRQILEAATACGMLDDLTAYCKSPDTVNDFCDAVEAMTAGREINPIANNAGNGNDA